MTRDVVTVREDAKLADALSLLADSHVTGLAVVDGRRQLIGVLSANDLVTAEAEAGDDETRARLLETALVREVMTPRPLTVSPQTELREAALQMEYADVHRLFVEVDGEVVGVISRSDVNRAYAGGQLG